MGGQLAEADALHFRHVGPGRQTQVDKPGGWCLWWLSCPSSRILTLLKNSWADSVSVKPWFGT